MTTAGQAIVDQLQKLDSDSGRKYSSQIHSIINQAVMLDADDQGAWEQAQAANKRLDDFEAAIKPLLRKPK